MSNPFALYTPTQAAQCGFESCLKFWLL